VGVRPLPGAATIECERRFARLVVDGGAAKASLSGLEARRNEAAARVGQLSEAREDAKLRCAGDDAVGYCERDYHAAKRHLRVRARPVRTGETTDFP